MPALSFSGVARRAMRLSYPHCTLDSVARKDGAPVDSTLAWKGRIASKLRTGRPYASGANNQITVGATGRSDDVLVKAVSDG